MTTRDTRHTEPAHQPPGSTDQANRRQLPQRLHALLELARPGQWPKNTLVVAAPFAAGQLEHPDVVGRTALMTLSFVAASAATYAANDLADVPADAAHPRKRNRPLARGALDTGTARGFVIAAAVTALATSLALGPAAALVVTLYLALTLSYSRWLKRVPVLEVAVVAAGFVLRALAGAAATHLPVSQWFLLVCLFGSLYLVLSKRAAESAHATTARRPHARLVLDAYPTTWLQQMMTVTLAGTVLTYALWAVQGVGTDVFAPVLAATVVPFLLVLMRYALLVSTGAGERPETDLFRDRFLLVAGGTWAVMCLVGLYFA